MKIRTTVIVSLAAIFALPAFACGPSTTGSSSGSSGGMSPARKQWTKKRVKHLRKQMDQYHNAQKFANGMDALDTFSTTSPAEKRRYWIARYEFLALKAEHGKAKAQDIAEMRWLQGKLLGR